MHKQITAKHQASSGVSPFLRMISNEAGYPQSGNVQGSRAVPRQPQSGIRADQIRQSMTGEEQERQQCPLSVFPDTSRTLARLASMGRCQLFLTVTHDCRHIGTCWSATAHVPGQGWLWIARPGAILCGGIRGMERNRLALASAHGSGIEGDAVLRNG